MGFFIGWRYFQESERYSPDYYEELNKEADEKRRRDDYAAQKQRRKEHEKRRQEKKKKREEWAKEAEEYQAQIDKHFQSNSGPGSTDGNDPASAFTKYGSTDKENYRDEISGRYGQLFNSQTDGEAPSLSRGFGVSPHQGVKREQKYGFHAPLGPLARKLRIPLGREQFNPNDKPSGRGFSKRSDQGDNGSGNSTPDTQGAAGSKLTRPF